jgi:predicted nucleic acid-binding protein
LPVVADAGPLIHLAQINKLHVVKELFGQVIITASVKHETVDEGAKFGYIDAKVIGKALREGWLIEEALPNRLMKTAIKLAEDENISQADAETLMLAEEKKAELLADDKIITHLAKMYGLKVWSTWTLLLDSLSRDLIKVADFEDPITTLAERKFRLNEQQTDEIRLAAKRVEREKKRVQTKK